MWENYPILMPKAAEKPSLDYHIFLDAGIILSISIKFTKQLSQCI